MFKKISLFLVAGLLMAGPVFAQVGSTSDAVNYPAKADETKNIELAKQAMQNLVDMYQAEREEAFFQNVSDRYLRSYVDFRTMVDSDFRTYNMIRIQYWIDREVEEGGRVNLNIHWERSWQPMTAGTPQLTQGHSKMVFEIMDGKATLVDQQEDALFGVTNM
ncbi:MAG: hypothetical protein HZC17_01930 [Candidatus Omnitrophica bacterium]|nr:hypothetical protein [Candidatus Omnitrophota bacterium]